MSPAQEDPALTSVSCLSDPVRRQLYEFVAASPEPVGRDEAAAAAGIGRAIAVYHLDKLVESGLLSASYRRPDGRSGPGAGRPAKFYARSGREFAVSVPPREYELAAHLLVQAVAGDHGGGSQVALREAARRFGEEAGARYLASEESSAARQNADAAGVTRALEVAGVTEVDTDAAGVTGALQGADAAGMGIGPDRTGMDAAGMSVGPGGTRTDAARMGVGPGGTGTDAAGVTGALRVHGFEPWADEDGTVVLRNCPFHRLAVEQREIVCGMNLALVDGLILGMRADGLRAMLDPRPGRCCVVIRGGQPQEEPPAGTQTTGAR